MISVGEALYQWLEFGIETIHTPGKGGDIMPLEDYSHHNEEATMIWWEEEGKHQPEDRFDADEDWRDEPRADDEYEEDDE
jgi:hypothetical protein